jgi:transposase
MTREEREEYVIQLYKEGKSIRQIAELVHMSFRDIGTLTKKVKLEAQRERGYTNDTEPKSPESRAFKLFSEGKSPIEVAIALDEPGDRVRAMYREYWELTGRYRLAQIYDEARYDIYGLLRLHKIVKDLGLNEQDIENVLDIAKHNELQNLQSKVEYLRNEVNTLEMEKWKSTNQILKLNRMIDEFQSSLAQKRGEMAYMNQETGWYDNTSNLYPIPYSEPDTSSYSIRLSYSDYWP